MKSRIVHYVPHMSWPQECDCRPVCHQRDDDEIQGSSDRKAVTCKNCLRSMAASQKRKSARESAQMRSHEAWMNEAGGGA